MVISYQSIFVLPSKHKKIQYVHNYHLLVEITQFFQIFNKQFIRATYYARLQSLQKSVNINNIIWQIIPGLGVMLCKPVMPVSFKNIPDLFSHSYTHDLKLIWPKFFGGLGLICAPPPLLGSGLISTPSPPPEHHIIPCILMSYIS